MTRRQDIGVRHKSMNTLKIILPAVVALYASACRPASLPRDDAQKALVASTKHDVEHGAQHHAAKQSSEKSQADATGNPTVKAMKTSLRSGTIKEISDEQVVDWKACGEEQVDGDTYQIGLVYYRAETLFGLKTIRAKALIKEGKVVRWVWPKSGIVIK